MKGGYFCNQCLPQRAKVTGQANLSKDTSVVQECTESEIDYTNQNADIKVTLAYHATAKVGQSTVAPKGT